MHETHRFLDNTDVLLSRFFFVKCGDRVSTHVDLTACVSVLELDRFPSPHPPTHSNYP